MAPSSHSVPGSGDMIHLVSGTDDGYAMPLTVMVCSVLAKLGSSRSITLHVLDGGISAESKERMLSSWRDPRLTVNWIQPDVNSLVDLMVSDHVNFATYLRLLMPDVLPQNVDRAIYLDADMLVRRDLGALWDEPQGNHAALATPCVGAPWIDASVRLANFNACRHYLAAVTPIRNYRALGIPADAPYLNGGMLVVNLDLWRREGLGRKMLACLREHRDHVLWWDQYALNVVLAGRWRVLDDRWNQGAHLYAYPSWQTSPLDKAAYERLARDPWIVHFASPSKPWHYFCGHPWTAEFRRGLHKTEWKDWRPRKPSPFLTAWWDFHYRPLQVKWKSKVRAFKQVLRRKAA